MSKKLKPVFFKSTTYFMVFILVIVSLFPLVWAIGGSFKSNSELYAFPYDVLPKEATFSNYKTLFDIGNFVTSLLNSAITSITATLISLIVACLGGYSLTRFTYPGSKILKRLVLDTYMIPSILLVLPIYSALTQFGMRDNLLAYTVMVTSTTLPFCLWLFTSYFKGVSVDYEEAAMVDGATRSHAFFTVVIPQLIPAGVAVGIQAFILAWNDLLFAKILLSSEKNRTLPLVISSMFARDQVYPWGVILAGTVIATVPILIMFVFGVDKLIGGWSEGGVKG